MDIVKHYENDQYVGKTNFHNGLLNSLVILSVKNTEGVAHTCSDSFKFRRVFNKCLRQGVDISYGPEGITIDVYLWIEFGHSVSNVSYRVQENIMNTISTLIEDKIKNINIIICGVEHGVQSKKIS
jgi:uncharacterized alkaline shock family protein YloU